MGKRTAEADRQRATHYHVRMVKSASAAASTVPTVSGVHLAVAIRAAGAMDLKEKETSCDRIYVAQPNLMGSVLAVRTFGVSRATIDILLEILIVLQLAIEESGQVLATVTELDQDRELRRFTAAIHFTEGLPGDATIDSIKQTTAHKREPLLLAYEPLAKLSV